jgi:glycerol transport system ATP-binding protein
MVAISLENISHSYDGKTLAVQDINIIFEDKKAHALLGPSGCGKTTILKIIAGLLKPTKGRICFDGKDVTELPPEQRNVAMVFQFPVVYSMTSLENIMFPLLNVKIPRSEKRDMAVKVAETVGLREMLNVRASSMGPADKQRVALARALIRKPNLFLFDEPMSSIEPDRRTALKSEIKRIQEQLSQTTIFVTHDQSEALTMAEKVAVMDMGRIIQYDSLNGIYNTPATDFVGFFIGSPGMNLLEGNLKASTVDLEDFQLPLPRNVKPPYSEGKIKIGIRPEHLKINQRSVENSIEFNIQESEDMGTGLKILYLASAHHKMKARVSADMVTGPSAYVSFPPEYTHFFDEKGARISATS